MSLLMKNKIRFVLSLFTAGVIGFLIGRQYDNQATVNIQDRESRRNPLTIKETVDKYAPPSPRQTSVAKTPNGSHNIGDTFKVKDLSITIGNPYYRKSILMKTCIVLPFTFSNESVGRVYTPDLRSMQLKDNFGNNCESIDIDQERNSYASRDTLLASDIESAQLELKPGQNGVQHFAFVQAIETATEYELNYLFGVTKDDGYWESKRLRVSYPIPIVQIHPIHDSTSKQDD